jgi:hypothetical protein
MKTFYESQESSSPIITRTVANSLIGKHTEIYQFSSIQKILLRIIGGLPQSVSEWIIPRANSNNALTAEVVRSIKTSDLINGRLADYAELNKKYPAITMGIGMGGTTAHLALALGGPFLPQAFVLTLKNGTMTGDVKAYESLTHEIAHHITEKNRDLMSIQHYDPIHDGWLVKRVNHLRLKLIDLPEEYKQFIREKLEPGGDLVYLEGNAKWKRFRTGERNVFQVGGWGDISAEEFIYGSERLSTFSKKEKLKYDHWFLDNFPIEDGAESEWGSEAGLGEALEEFCKEEGFNFLKISYDDPNDFSRLAFNTKQHMLKKQGIDPKGVVVEMFSQFDTEIVDHTALLPFWLIFNTFDSLRVLEEMSKEFQKDLPVFFSGLSTFSITPDLVLWDRWQEALKSFQMINIGARKNHFPADPVALLDWKKPLINWAKNQPRIELHISGKELETIACSF